MLENIRRIGIFMIVAQTMIHFAAGRQYEKYMKIIASVIVLLQFVTPFVSSTVDMTAEWQEEIEKMTEQTERLSDAWQSESAITNHAKTNAVRQIEEEMKTRLNELIADREYYIEDISIELKENGNHINSGTMAEQYGWEFQFVRILLRGRMSTENEIQNETPADSIQNIQIEEIRIGSQKEQDVQNDEKETLEHDMVLQEYRQLFAQMLGIAIDRVEVSCYGE